MSAPYILTATNTVFPDPNTALSDPNGLLAIGGDLTATRLITAYQQGIFPWFDGDQPILWWSPDPRAVLYLNELHISHSLAKKLRQTNYSVTFDQAFSAVITACAEPRKNSDGTWITQEMIQAYIELHAMGYAHSVEVWSETKLIGGLYGLTIGKIFCGESMFSRQADSSKIALVYLVEKLRQEHFQLIDCQVLNPHSSSLGAREIPRSEFLLALKHYGKS